MSVLSMKKNNDNDDDEGKCGSSESLTHYATSLLSKITNLLHAPCDPSCLGVVRALFGLMMFLDIPYERDLHNIQKRFGDPMNCHFPLFNFISPLSFEYMGLLYLVMWMGSLGMCIGYKFRCSCIMFAIPYWYLFLLDKTTWNNHSYLYGLVSFQFLFSSAHHAFSLDSIINKNLRNKPIAVWNYWIIRFQFFLMYFYAGLKKLDPDWLGGHSMTSLGTHWVFDPFRILLSDEQIDLWIIHKFGFAFDLSVGFFLLWDRTRPIAIVFSSAFHLMNSRMFHIGQFPYVCLVTTPIFCDYSWPRKCMSSVTHEHHVPLKDKDSNGDNQTVIMSRSNVAPTARKKFATVLLLSYVLMQLALPYSHSLTKGYNNWTNGLYGYSWDMMVHSWDTKLISIKIHDHDTDKQHYMDPQAWVQNTRYSKHADMVVQYASCIKNNLRSLSKNKKEFQNISIYIDVWCSLNNRFLQRFVDPRQDILTAAWHPFKTTTWVVPLLTELSSWRSQRSLIHSHVLSWNNRSDSLFVADLPGLYLEHYIQPALSNVTLTVLEGSVTVLTENKNISLNRSSKSWKVKSGLYHTVMTTSEKPSCFMYTYVNSTDIGHIMESDNGDQYNLFGGMALRMVYFKRSLASLWLGLTGIQKFWFG